MKKYIIFALLCFGLAINVNAQQLAPYCDASTNGCPSAITQTKTLLGSDGVSYTITYKVCNGTLNIVGMTVQNGTNQLYGVEVRNLLPLIFEDDPSINAITFPGSCYKDINTYSANNPPAESSTTKPKILISFCGNTCCYFERGMDLEGDTTSHIDDQKSCPISGCTYPICFSN